MSYSRIKILALLFWLGAMAAPAGTYYWFDNFETNAGYKWTTNSAWKIGSPTTGPAKNAAGSRAFSGTNCATTGLTGNAPNNADSRLVCINYNGQPYLKVPAASAYPRLRYWQWFDFVNALGVVEVQTEGGTNWQAISATNISVGSTASSSGGWTEPSIDLTAFAGTNIQVAFHFISGGGGYGNDLGWYVDDVGLVTNNPVFNDPETFEGGLGDWSVDNGSWQVGNASTSVPKATFPGAGTNCAGTALSGTYPFNADTRLISPPFTVPPSNSPALQFWQWYKFINALGFVEITKAQTLTNYSYTTNFLTATNVEFDTNIISVTNVDFPNADYYQTNVVTFTNLDTDTFIYGATNSLSTNTLTFTNLETGSNVFLVGSNQSSEIYLQTNAYIFTNLNQFAAGVTTNIALVTVDWQTISETNISIGSSSLTSGANWTSASLDLSAFAGQSVQVAFHFQSGGTGYGTAPGWFVDNVSVVTMPTLTVPTNQMILVGQTFTNSAAATNSLAPDANYTFRFATPSTNAFISPDGTIVGWTNRSPANGSVTLSIVAADTNSPPVQVTNSFIVTVVPAAAYTMVTMPADQTIVAGQTFTTTVSATNSLVPDAIYTFSFAAHSTNATITTNGVINWTNTSPALGSSTLSVVVSDTNPPPVQITNSFNVTVLPGYSFTISNSPVHGKPFILALQSRTNLIWQIQASTDLLDWVPVWTNSTLKSGFLLYTDLMTTNFPHRFYRAVP